MRARDARGVIPMDEATKRKLISVGKAMFDNHQEKSGDGFLSWQQNLSNEYHTTCRTTANSNRYHRVLNE